MRFILFILVIPTLSVSAAHAAAIQCRAAFSETVRKKTSLAEERFTLRAANGKLGTPLDFKMPEGFDSFQVDVLGAADRNYIVSTLIAENGKVLITTDLSQLEKSILNNVDTVRNALEDTDSIQTGPYLSPERSLIGYLGGNAGLSVAPDKTNGKINPGKYRAQISYIGDAAAHDIQVRITYKKKLPPNAKAVLPLQVFFTEARGWNQQSPEFQEVIRRVNQILSPAKVQVEIEAATMLKESSVVQDAPSILKSLSVTLPTARSALKVCLCENAYLPELGQLYGISTTIPGPVPSGKFASSGVVVAIGNKMTTSVQELGIILTHEILHYLGLSHTYEIKANLEDSFADTESRTAQNIMNPSPARGIDYPSLSPEQAEAIRAHPLVQRATAK